MHPALQLSALPVRPSSWRGSPMETVMSDESETADDSAATELNDAHRQTEPKGDAGDSGGEDEGSVAKEGNDEPERRSEADHEVE